MARKTLHGNVVATEEGEKMGQNRFQLDEEKADLDKDGQVSSYERARGEAVQKAMGEEQVPGLMMGGMMMDSDPFAPFQVVIDVDEASGNHVPAGSKDEEVRDDIPALLSEGEYVVPADVVRYHGLKTFEELRCEAKHALGLMAMHDRISMVDEDTKEPVEYDIEEKDAPKVEKAEVKVVEAESGTDIQTGYYQLQYMTDPVTGELQMAYVDPVTGEQISEEEYEEARASRFKPQAVLEREVYEGIDAEEEAEEAVEEAMPACPPGYRRDPYSNQCVPIVVDSGGDGPEEDRGMDLPDAFETSALSELEQSLGLDTTFGSQYGPDAKPQGPGGLAAAFGPLGAIAEKVITGVKKSFAKNDVYDALSKNLGITKTEAKELVKTEYVASVADKVRSGESNYENVEIGGNTYGVTKGGGVVNGRTTLTPNEAARRGAIRVMDIYTSSSNDNNDDRGSFTQDTSGITSRSSDYTPSSAADRRGDTNRDQGGNDSPSSSQSDSQSSASAAQDDPSAGFGGYAKGGMPSRKNTPKVAMIKYSKGTN